MSTKRKRAAESLPPTAPTRGRGGDKIHENWVKGSEQQANIHVTMPRQPTLDGRQNGCWVPPVVALANFYNLKPSHDATGSALGNGNTDGDDADTRVDDVGADDAVKPDQDIVGDMVAIAHTKPKVGGDLNVVGNDKSNDVKVTVESVLALWPGDDAEGVFEIMENLFGTCMVGNSWGDESTNDEHCGPTYAGDGNVSEPWFTDLRVTIDNNDLVVLLVERLDSGKDKGNIHYLLVLGYKAVFKRRGNRYTLYVKDGMEGDTLLEATLWDACSVELTTKVPSGTTLDRYKILESVSVTL